MDHKINFMIHANILWIENSVDPGLNLHCQFQKRVYNSERAIGYGALPMSSVVFNIKRRHAILIRLALSSNDGSGTGSPEPSLLA